MNYIRLWLIRAQISWLIGKQSHLFALAEEQRSKAAHAERDADAISDQIEQLTRQEMLLVDPRDQLNREI